MVGASLCLVAAPIAAQDDPALAERVERPPALTEIESVMIDPGHGGSDAGCIGVSGVAEKWLTLKISRQLRRALAEEYPELATGMTRDEDAYPTLEERTHMANLMGADLFLSLHFNCAENHLAEGIETFFLHPEGTSPGEEVPGLEHQGETLHRVEYGVMGDVSELIVSDLIRAGAMLESARLAESIQRELIDATRMTNRGVRFARFRVLRGAHMPAVVVELGFLTNEDESERLMTTEVLNELVAGMVAGLADYDASLRARAAAAALD